MKVLPVNWFMKGLKRVTQWGAELLTKYMPTIEIIQWLEEGYISGQHLEKDVKTRVKSRWNRLKELLKPIIHDFNINAEPIIIKIEVSLGMNRLEEAKAKLKLVGSTVGPVLESGAKNTLAGVRNLFGKTKRALTARLQRMSEMADEKYSKSAQQKQSTSPVPLPAIGEQVYRYANNTRDNSVFNKQHRDMEKEAYIREQEEFHAWVHAEDSNSESSDLFKGIEELNDEPLTRRRAICRGSNAKFADRHRTAAREATLEAARACHTRSMRS